MRHKPSRLCLGVAKLILLVELCKSLSYFLLYGYFCLEGRGEFTHFAHCDFRIFRKGANFCWISLSGCLKIGGYYTISNSAANWRCSTPFSSLNSLIFFPNNISISFLFVFFRNCDFPIATTVSTDALNDTSLSKFANLFLDTSC